MPSANLPGELRTLNRAHLSRLTHAQFQRNRSAVSTAHSRLTATGNTQPARRCFLRPAWATQPLMVQRAAVWGSAHRRVRGGSAPGLTTGGPETNFLSQAAALGSLPARRAAHSRHSRLATQGAVVRAGGGRTVLVAWCSEPTHSGGFCVFAFSPESNEGAR